MCKSIEMTRLIRCVMGWMVMGALMLNLSSRVVAQEIKPDLSGLGRAARPNELAAWNTDVRADFQGLPPGQGSVKEGELLWEQKCARCHGSFGESHSHTNPLLGGITPDDVKKGRVAAQAPDSKVPVSTLMKVATVSTLWDFVRRAMPWDAPKSLSTNEVYASLAYLFFLADLVEADFVLSDKTLPKIQNLLPNRFGMTLDHGLGSVNGKPDVNQPACMKDCVVGEPKVKVIPTRMKQIHGNLEDQMRDFGAFRGVTLETKAAKP